jgi:hypothetical protein
MAANANTSKGGEHATARRGGIAEDAAFIMAKANAGVPESAIARMGGRTVADVRVLTRAPVLQAVKRHVVTAPEPVQTVPALVAVPTVAKPKVRQVRGMSPARQRRHPARRRLLRRDLR